MSSPRSGTQTSQQSCWSSCRKWKRPRCEQHSYLSHALALGRPGRNSSSARANSSTLPCFNARPSRLFCEVHFLCSRFYFAAHQGVVCMAISTLITTCDLDACKGGASGEDQVKLMAVLRSWVSPEDSVLGAWYWRTCYWHRGCNDSKTLAGVGRFRSSSQCKTDPSKRTMSFDQHQRWHWSRREWTVALLQGPLMVVASLSFASSGESQSRSMIRVTGPTDGWSFSDKISLHLQEMDPSCQKRWNFFPWQTLNLAASSLEERLCPFAVWLVPYRWLLS